MGDSLDEQLKRTRLATELAKAKAAKITLEQKQLALDQAKAAAARNAPGPFHKSQRDLARALGRSDGWLTAAKRKPGAPRKTREGWDESEWIRWMHDEAPTGHGSKPPPDGRIDQGVERKLNAEAEAYLGLLEAGADPLEMCRAAMQLAGLRMAESFRRGGRMARELPDFIKAQDALRKAEASRLKLDEQKGLLVSVDVARVAGAALARGFVRALTNIETGLTAQIESWLGDEKMRAMDAKERARIIRDWVKRQSHESRNLARDGLGKVLDETIHDMKSDS